MKLLIVWKSSNTTDIEKFIIPYALNSKKQEWFKEVTVLIWGASQEYVRDNDSVHKSIKQLIDNSVSIYACKMCADGINATTILTTLGVNVQYTGELLSNALLDEETKVITL